MKIVVTTPTGHIGSRIVQILIQAGMRPTVLARDVTRLSEDVRAATDARQGNLSDAEFVGQATEGADALFWLVPSNYGSDDPIGEMLQLGENAAAAIRKNGIGRVVLLSSVGAEQKGDGFIGTLGKVEELLNATGANVVSLRPGYFYTNLLMDAESLKQGVLPTAMPLDLPMPWNDPSDIAGVAAARLLSPDWSGQIVQLLNGPRDYTFAEVAATVSAVTGKSVQALAVTDEQSRDAIISAGISPAAADALVAMSRNLRERPVALPPRDITSTLSTPLEGWIYANLRPVLSQQ